jgi:NMD protein affecting ribosome stability and mRNA decay
MVPLGWEATAVDQRICVNCGAPVPPDFTRTCNKCWQPWDIRTVAAEEDLERAAADGTDPRICVNCGAVVPPEFTRLCNKCWQPWRHRNPVAEAELEQATQKWTLPLVPRTYQDNEADKRRLTFESRVLTEHGYEASL